ncbi:MAG: DNA repair protein RecN [Desulfatiglans sp.]|jgi:DNA repair protein RecN (Recombination protein N)|nr:DNA repair protein RecN [Desulfatiglans sp.]
MLSHLIISDFAIISHLEIEFRAGLNILSGETGAGKSIIINAVNLILGGRASSDLIRSGASEARVEALFYQPENASLSRFMSENSIPFNGEIIIKRTISKEGKNRITVNNSITTLQTLSSIGMMIISISGQHEHQVLLRPDNHLFLLDDLGNLSDRRYSLTELFLSYESYLKRVRQLESEIKTQREKMELSSFQVNEIDSAGIRDNEDRELEEEKKRLRNAEQIREVMTGSYYRIYEKEGSILSEISLCLKDMRTGSGYDNRLSDLVNALESIKAELEDVSFRLGDLKDGLHADPERLEQVEERLQLLNGLKRKYGRELTDVITYRDRLIRQINDTDRLEKELEENEKHLEAVIESLLIEADNLSKDRKKIAVEMEKAIELELGLLEMAGTRFKVKFNDVLTACGNNQSSLLNMIGPEGYDRAEFMISTNVGEDLKPLSKIASGGELSRIMLAMKTILARKTSVETIIFDEVDAGIAGATAEKVGEKINELSQFHQIICITHLPQIASKGNNHFLVKKGIKEGRTQTLISELNHDERIHEIARLMGGRKVTDQAIAHAKEILSMT